MDSPLLGAISSLRLPLSSSDYERVKWVLSFTETRLKSEKDEVTRKFNNALMENNILTKQLEQYKKEDGELLLSKSELNYQLTESVAECSRLRVRLATAEQEVQGLNDEAEGKFRDLSNEVKMLKSEKDEVTRKFNNALMENNILTKQLEQYKKEDGELLLSKSELNYQLTESVAECSRLRVRLATAEQEVQRLNDEAEGKFRDLSNEVKMLKKQNAELSDDYAGLEARKMKIEEEFRVCRFENESLKGTVKFLEEEKKGMEKKVKEAEKVREENSKLTLKNTKLERDLDSVTTAATHRFRTFEKRLSELEQAVAILNDNGSGSGSQLVDTTQVLQEQESYLEAKHERPVEKLTGHETSPNEEKTASSMPCPKETSATHVHRQSDSFESDTRPERLMGARPVSEEKSASSSPCTRKFPLSSTNVVDLCSSDDDGEIPSSKGLKRKLSSSEVPLGIKSHMESISPSKKTMATLKPCEHENIGVSLDEKCHRVGDVHGELGSINKNWDFEADLLDDLQKNTELCMEGLCALYRQKALNLYTLRGTSLAKFLTDSQGSRKTLSDLERFDPKGADDCKKIALAHSRQLFDIYKSGKDPNFAPAVISSQKTAM